MKQVLLVILIILWVASFSVCKVNTERLAEEFRERLKHERFEQIYDNASVRIHHNVTKEEFSDYSATNPKRLEAASTDLIPSVCNPKRNIFRAAFTSRSISRPQL